MSIEVSHYIEKRIINLLLFAMELKKEVPLTNVNFVLINQIARTIKSLRRIYEETRSAKQKEEFAQAMSDFRRELKETKYWLRILKESNNNKFYKLIDDLEDESEELIMISTKFITMQN